MDIDLTNFIIYLSKYKDITITPFAMADLNRIMLRILCVIKDRSFVFSIKNNRGSIDNYSISETILSLYPKHLRYEIMNKSQSEAGEYDAKIYYNKMTLSDIKSEMIIPFESIIECIQMSNDIYGCKHLIIDSYIIYLGCILKQTLLYIFNCVKNRFNINVIDTDNLSILSKNELEQLFNKFNIRYTDILIIDKIYY